MDVGIHRLGAASKSVLANPNAASPVATNRLLAWSSPIRMVRILANPSNHEGSHVLTVGYGPSGTTWKPLAWA
jgi:hypothetical protein